MANPFDQFDDQQDSGQGENAQAAGNPFDQFDEPAQADGAGDFDQFDEPEAAPEEKAKGPGALDDVKTLAGGLTEGVGQMVSGGGSLFEQGGELIERGLSAIGLGGAVQSANNRIADTGIDALAPGNALIKAGRYAEQTGRNTKESRSEAAKLAQQNTTPEGELFNPNTWNFGKDPSLRGAIYGIEDVASQLAPQLMSGGIGRALSGVNRSRQAGNAAAATSSAVSGGLQSMGGNASATRERLEALSDDELAEAAPRFNELRQTMSADQARQQTIKEAEQSAGNFAAPIGLLGGALLHGLTGPIQRYIGGGMATRTAGGAITGGLAEAGQGVSEQVAANVGENVGTGGNRDIFSDTFQAAVMSAGPGAALGAGGALTNEGRAPNAEDESNVVSEYAGNQGDGSTNQPTEADIEAMRREEESEDGQVSLEPRNMESEQADPSTESPESSTDQAGSENETAETESAELPDRMAEWREQNPGRSPSADEELAIRDQEARDWFEQRRAQQQREQEQKRATPEQDEGPRRTRPELGIDNDIRVAEQVGADDDAIRLRNARGLFERAHEYEQAGDARMASRTRKRGLDIYRDIYGDPDSPMPKRDPSFPAPYVATGEYQTGAEAAEPGTDVGPVRQGDPEPGETYDGEPGDPRIDGPEPRNDAGRLRQGDQKTGESIIYGDGPIAMGRWNGNANTGMDRPTRNARVNETPEAEASQPDERSQRERERAQRLAREGASTRGVTSTAYLPDNTELRTQYRVVNADELNVSHDESGRANPFYPSELQPRDRTSRTSQLQITRMAQNLQPERLAESPNAGDGAPIIGRDGSVESGNGRSAAIRRAYQQGRGEKYKRYLIDNADRLGIDPAAIRKMGAPVLVRERLTRMDRNEFARRSNDSNVAGMSSAETATQDARGIDSDMMAKWAPDQSGDATAASNRAFTRRFIQGIGQNEASRYLTSDGKPTPELNKRMRSAVFARAYRDPDLVSLATDERGNMRNVVNAMSEAAPDFARARNTGSTEAAQIADAFNEAVRILERARSDGRSVHSLVGQDDAFSGSVSDDVRDLALLLDANMGRPSAMRAAVSSLAAVTRERAESRQNQALFEDETTTGDVINEAGRRAQAAEPEQGTQDTGAEASQQPAGAQRDTGDDQARRPAEGRQADRAESATGQPDPEEMTPEQISDEITRINDKAKAAQNGYLETGPDVLPALDYLSDAERKRMYDLKNALPSEAYERAQAAKRVRQRAAERKARRDQKRQFSFAGKQSRTANADSMSRAGHMLENGADSEQVRKETGWHRGPDGALRYEIPDNNAKLKPALKGLGKLKPEPVTIDRVSFVDHGDGTVSVDMIPQNMQNINDAVTLHRVKREVYRGIVPAEVRRQIESDPGAEGLLTDTDGEWLDAREHRVSFETRGYNALYADEVLDHPRLFAAYPALRGVQVMVNPDIGSNRAELQSMQNGSYRVVLGNNGNSALSLMLHELQHGIQDIEGFAQGSSYDRSREALRIKRQRILDAKQADYDAAAERVPDAVREASDAVEAAQVEGADNDRLNELLDAYDEAVAAAGGFEDADIDAFAAAKFDLEDARYDVNNINDAEIMEAYRQSAGEVEARNVQRRSRMTPAERREVSPLESMDTLPDQIEVSFGDGNYQSVPTPANARDYQQAMIERSKAGHAFEALHKRIRDVPEFKGTRLVEDARSIPRTVRMEAARAGVNPDSIRGWHDEQGAHVVVGAHDSLGDAVKTLVHENVGHRGLRGVLGDDFTGTMSGMYSTMAADKNWRGAMADIRRDYPHLDARTRDGKAQIAEEIFARAIESDQRPRGWQRALSRIRQMLRRAFPGINWTHTDVMALAEQSRQWLRRNPGSETYTGPTAFSFMDGKKRRPLSEEFDDLSEAAQRGLDKTDVPPPEKKVAEYMHDLSHRAGRRFHQAVFDRYSSLKELDAKLYGQDFIESSITKSSWVMARMASAAGGAVSTMMDHGRIRLNPDQKIVELKEDGSTGLASVLSQLGSEAEIKRFFGWIAGNRSHKLAQEGKENYFKADEIEGLRRLNNGRVAGGRERRPLYDKVFDEFQQYRDDVLAIAEQSGVISPEARAMWRDEFYVPFYRELGPDEKSGMQAGGGLSRQEATKRIKGSNKPLRDLLENTMMNFNHLIEASLKNQAAMQAIDNSLELGIAEKVPEARADKKVSTFILRNGQKEWYEIADPLVHQSLSSMTQTGMDQGIMKFFRTFKRLLTNTVTITPSFIVTNTFRDAIQASATTPSSFNPFMNTIKGAAAYSDQKTRAAMLASGASFSFGHLSGTNADDIRRNMTRQYRKANLIKEPTDAVPLLRQLSRPVRGGWRKWNDITNYSENMTRANVYKTNLPKGKLRAAFEARDVMDFSGQGANRVVRILCEAIPFLNARLQGLDKINRSGTAPVLKTLMGKGSPGEKKQAARFAAVAGVLSMAGAALQLNNQDNEDFRKLEEWEKDTYWHVFVGDAHWRIPKPFEVGAIATIAERITEQFSDDKATGKLFAERMKFMFTQTFAFDVMPQAFAPVSEIYANKDSFTGRDIETQAMQRLSPELRARDTTTNVARGISKASNAAFSKDGPLWWMPGADKLTLSPVQVDHLINGYTGSMGSWVAGSADNMIRALKGEPSPSKHWYERSIFTRFYKDTQNPDAYNRYSTLFYEAMNEANQAYADVRKYRELGNIDAAQKVVEDKRDMLALRQSMNRAQRNLSDINKRLSEVRRSKKSGDEKRQEIDRLNSIREQIMTEIGKRVEIIKASKK